MTNFRMKAARAVAPYALTVSSLIPAALPHRGLEEALLEREHAIVGPMGFDAPLEANWDHANVLFSHLLSDFHFKWFDQHVYDAEFVVPESIYGEVEVLHDIEVEDDTPILHAIGEPDLTAIEALVEKDAKR